MSHLTIPFTLTVQHTAAFPTTTSNLTAKHGGYQILSTEFIHRTDFIHRTHQLLGYDTPDQVYRTGSGGGARIVDKFSTTEKTLLEKEAKKRGSAVQLHVIGDHLKLDALLS